MSTFPSVSQGACEHITEALDVVLEAASAQTEPQSNGLYAGNLADAFTLTRPHLPWAQSPHSPPFDITVHLVEVYFESVQPDFPLLHRPSILKRLYSGSLATEKYSSLFFNALFALATKFTDDPRAHSFDLSLAQGLSGIEFPGTTHTQRTNRHERGRGFSRRASELFQDMVQELENLELDVNMADKPSILLIQGAVMLSYAELARGAIHRAHSLISTCVRMAYDAGLDRIDSAEHLQSTDPILPSQTTDWRREELRRAWWCIWELESFVCTFICRTRIIKQTTCQTKLPMDDLDWFEGTEVPLYLLPSNFEQWSEFGNASPRISLLANRIVALHFMLTVVELEGNESPELSTTYSETKRCVAIWRKTLPREFKSKFQYPNSPDYLDACDKRLSLHIFNEESVSDPTSRLNADL